MKFKEFISKNWIWIVISLLVVGAMIYFYFEGKEDEEKKGLVEFDPSKAPIPDEAIAPGGQPVPEETKQKIIAMAKNLYFDMNCVFCNRDIELWNRFNLYTGAELVATSNVFNIYYEQKSGETFINWIVNENFQPLHPELNGLRNGIVARLQSLGVN